MADIRVQEFIIETVGQEIYLYTKEGKAFTHTDKRLEASAIEVMTIVNMYRRGRSRKGIVDDGLHYPTMGIPDMLEQAVRFIPVLVEALKHKDEHLLRLEKEEYEARVKASQLAEDKKKLTERNDVLSQRLEKIDVKDVESVKDRNKAMTKKSKGDNK